MLGGKRWRAYDDPSRACPPRKNLEISVPRCILAWFLTASIIILLLEYSYSHCLGIVKKKIP